MTKLAMKLPALKHLWCSLVLPVLACCVITKAQGEEDITRARDEFISQIFTKCNDTTYYFGPREMNASSCAIVNPTNRVDTARKVTGCAEMIEYTNLTLAPSVAVLEQNSHQTKLLQPKGTLELHVASDPPGIERVLVILAYTSSRSRMRVTSQLLESGTGAAQDWDPWERSIANVRPPTLLDVGDRHYQLLPGTVAFGTMIKRNGKWTFAPGPDFPLLNSLSQDFGRVGVDLGPLGDIVGQQMRSPGVTAILPPFSQLMASSGGIQKIAANKPASCEEFFPAALPTSIVSRPAPGTQVVRDAAGAIVITSNTGAEESEYKVWYQRGSTPFMLKAVIAGRQGQWKIQLNGLIPNGKFPVRTVKVSLGARDYGIRSDDPGQQRAYGNLIQRLQSNVDAALQIADTYNRAHPNDHAPINNLPAFVPVGEALAPAGAQPATPTASGIPEKRGQAQRFR